MKPFRRILIGLFFVAMPMAMLYPLWGNPVSAGEDDAGYYWPLRVLVGEALRDGRAPLVNRYEAMGMPLMADPQSAVLHAPTWLFAVLDAQRAYSLSIFIAFSLAGGGTYLYLRRLGLGRPPAMLGATVFMFSGFMVGHRVHLSVLHTAAMLPWGLWGVEMLGCRPWRAMAILSAAVFTAIAAGHWPTLVHMGLIGGAYLLLRGRPLGRAALVAAAAVLLAGAMSMAQLSMTHELLGQTTRQRIGYAMLGENSFFPLAGVLAMFPLLMGSRTPGFYPQSYWGPWHLCEMLGYVGLLTLVLAMGAIRWLWRKPKPNVPAGDGLAPPLGLEAAQSLRPVVRAWTWLAAGAGVWMLGYYLPTYKLIHMLPVLGVMRCPARMVVGVDMALAVLAAVAVEAMTREGRLAPSRLGQTLRRLACIALPLVMLASLGVLGLAAGRLRDTWPGPVPMLAGTIADVLESLRLSNPAVWAPLGLMLLTAGVVVVWLGAPARRAWMLIPLILLDLFTVTRFLDVPGGKVPAADPVDSPAARWLAANDGCEPWKTPDYRVWGLSDTYFDRQGELLLPKTAHALGVATLNTYGPFQTPAHAHLLGFRIAGDNPDWARLVRQNYLLSLYRVKYLVASEARHREVIESVRVPEAPPPELGQNGLTGPWTVSHAELAWPTGSPDAGNRPVLTLVTPYLWRLSQARVGLTLESGQTYRVSFDARGPDGGAANFLRVQVWQALADGSWHCGEAMRFTLHDERIGQDLRHFEWTFDVPRPSQPVIGGLLRFYTMSERPIEVRNVAVRPAAWETPVLLPGSSLQPGSRVYELVAELASLGPAGAPVAIYRNRLVSPGRIDPGTMDRIEMLKWRPQEYFARYGVAIPPLGLGLIAPKPWALEATLAGLGVWVVLAAGCLLFGRKG